jgi:hypothetical protein
MIRSKPYHKQESKPQTLAEAISFDQQRREAAYQEWLTMKKRFQEEQKKALAKQKYQYFVDKA